MITKINRTDAIRAKLKEDGKVTSLDQTQHIEAIIAMNEHLESIRREYQVKDRNSQITASTVILTA